MENFDKIFLIGFMGSGKSTIGRKLASKLGWSFIDLDQKIEEKAGKEISRIFSEDGEAYFRNLETEILREAVAVTRAVISTGGGTPCYPGNMDILTSHGLTVYLRRTPEQLRSRLSASTSGRPLLKDVDEDNLLAFIVRKLNERENWYLKAGLVTDLPAEHFEDLYAEVRKLMEG